MEPTVTSMSEDFEITGSTSPSLYLQQWIFALDLRGISHNLIAVTFEYSSGLQ